jgi:hypothetical protein
MRNLILIAAGLVSLAACHSPLHRCTHHNEHLHPVDEANCLIETCYWAIDELLAQHPFPEDIDRVLVSTVVDINDVQSTTMFGRVTSECLSSRLTQLNKDVIHLTVRSDHMLVRPAGNFLLSREVRNLAMDYNARTALVSTYAVTEHSVILSLKLVSTIEDSTLAGIDVAIPRSDTVTEMLGLGGGLGISY